MFIDIGYRKADVSLALGGRFRRLTAARGWAGVASHDGRVCGCPAASSAAAGLRGGPRESLPAV